MTTKRYRPAWADLSAVLAIYLLGVVATVAQAPTATPKPAVTLANPASDNCVSTGGGLIIEQRGDGGEYGVCLFEDNRQCEEWALFRRECAVGGVKVTGYVTAAARCLNSSGPRAILTLGKTVHLTNARSRTMSKRQV